VSWVYTYLNPTTGLWVPATSLPFLADDSSGKLDVVNPSNQYGGEDSTSPVVYQLKLTVSTSDRTTSIDFSIELVKKCDPTLFFTPSTLTDQVYTINEPAPSSLLYQWPHLHQDIYCKVTYTLSQDASLNAATTFDGSYDDTVHKYEFQTIDNNLESAGQPGDVYTI